MHFAFTRHYSVFDLHAYGCTVEIWSGFQILFCALSDRSISIIGKFRDWAFYFFYHFGNIIKWCIYIQTSISVITTDHVPSLRVIIIYVRLVHKPRRVTSCLHTYTQTHFYDTCGSLMFNSVIISLKQPIVRWKRTIYCVILYIYIIIKPWKRLYIVNPQTMVWFL